MQKAIFDETSLGFLNIQPKLKMLTFFVYSNEESFMQTFAPNFKNSDLIGLWFGGDSVKTHYVDLFGGQHYADEIPNEKFSAWMKSRI
jgi:hypothetical protein